MKKYLIAYYSKSGNNEFLAQKIAQELGDGSPMKIKPALNFIPIVFFLTRLNFTGGTSISQKKIEEFDEIIILGPVWGGRLISPLRGMILQCVKAAKTIHFAVSCDSSDQDKDSKYGYGQVLQSAKQLGGHFIKNTEAFPTILLKADNESLESNLFKKVKFAEDNFKGSIQSRLSNWIRKIES